MRDEARSMALAGNGLDLSTFSSVSNGEMTVISPLGRSPPRTGAPHLLVLKAHFLHGFR